MKVQPPRHCLPTPQRRQDSGVALVIALALIVLVTIATVAFFVRATSNRAIETARTNQVLVKQIAATAVDYVAGGFLREIEENSSSATVSGSVVYQPNSSDFAVAQRTVNPTLLSDPGFSNLIRRSVNETSNGVAETNASSHNTTAPSKNQRSIGASRWNAPFLTSGVSFTTANQLPNWIYLNRDGSTTATPSSETIGRFAYNVYDISGLLDVNVAGYPSTLGSAALATIHGTLASADLSAVPGVTSTDDLIDWRNDAAVADYPATVFDVANDGFLRPAVGDMRFTSRHDLIRLAKNGSFGLSTSALPYFTHFSRSLNAPSWTPLLNAPDTPDYDASLVTAARSYKDNADSSTHPNRNIPNVRVTVPFTRRDGTAAQTGEPLINRRFPLNKLALVRANPGTNAAEVEDLFGLTWNPSSDAWEYRALTINLLEEVAAAGREPDFFELLKAGILDGSLGKSTANDTLVRNLSPDTNTDLQILRIGANLIDQADANDLPTTILRSAAAEIVLGIENHPYLHLLSQTHFRRQDRDYDPSDPDNPWPWIAGFQQVQVWNPHTNAPAGGRNYRIRATQGVTRAQVRNIAIGNPVDQTDRFITFSDSASFAEPTLLTPDNITGASPEHQAADLIGFHLGDVDAPNNIDGDGDQTNDFDPSGNDASYLYDLPVVYQLEFSDGGSWIPIQRIYPLFGSTGQSQGSMWTISNWIWDAASPLRRLMVVSYCKTDPRVQRFGFYLAATGNNLNNNTLRRPATGSGHSVWGGGLNGSDANANPGWKVSYPLPTSNSVTTLGYTPGDLSDNQPSTPTHIAGRDGVVRTADGTRSTNIPGNKTAVAATSNPRPVVLNRPFVNVGEMGYALRGDPWKTLDLASPGSADSALLDLFSVSDMPVIQAGVINPNRASAEVLQALLTGAELDPILTSTALSMTDAGTIASELADQLQLGATAVPIQNRADLVQKIQALSAIPNATHKRQVEVFVRALADVSNTRTWNFMVDTVAQTGSFSSTGFDAGDFVVRGEERIWAQLAIDRPTGKVIAQSIEICPE